MRGGSDDPDIITVKPGNVLQQAQPIGVDTIIIGDKNPLAFQLSDDIRVRVQGQSWGHAEMTLIPPM